MASDADSPDRLQRGTPAYYAECARLLRIQQGDDALIFAIGMVQMAVEATNEEAYEAWCEITDILCKEEGRAPFGTASWIYIGSRPSRDPARPTTRH
jgi:hypothetical protein